MVRVRLTIIAAVLAIAPPAFALQPLSEFLAGARRSNVDDREAALVAIEQREEALAREVPVINIEPADSGPGAAARNSIGLVLVAGMAMGTAFTLFFVPAIYMLIARQHRPEAEPVLLPTAEPWPAR